MWYFECGIVNYLVFMAWCFGFFEPRKARKARNQVDGFFLPRMLPGAAQVFFCKSDFNLKLKVG